MVVTKTGAKIQAAGSGKKLCGFRHGAQRPDLVVLDDIENDENVRTPEQRDKLEAWVDKAVDPLGPPDGSMDIIFVNTFLHHDSVACRKSVNPMWRAAVFRAVRRWPDRMDLWERWEEILRNEGRDLADAFHAESQAAMTAGAEVLWPAVQPLKLLMEIRVRVGQPAFDSEYQNEPLDEAAALFGKVEFWVHEVKTWIYVGACDPSLGKNNRRSDPSAILIGGFCRETGVLDVVEADIRRRLPDRIIEDIIKYQKAYRLVKFGIETVQFQDFLRTELIKRSAAAGAPVPAVAIANSTDKALRIESIQPHVVNELIRIHPSHTTLLYQLRHWPQADHDDGPDCLEMLWRVASMVRAGGGGVRTAGRRVVTPRGMSGFLS